MTSGGQGGGSWLVRTAVTVLAFSLALYYAAQLIEAVWLTLVVVAASVLGLALIARWLWRRWTRW